MRPLEATGERVRVAVVQEGDLAPYRLAVEESRERLSAWNPVNPGDLVGHLRAQSRVHRTFLIHAREPVGDHDIVGKVNVTNVVHGRFCSAGMGYDAYDPYAGRGLFAEGLRLVVGLAFAPEPEGMGLHRVEASVQPGNLASGGLLRSLGFRREGWSPRMMWLSDAAGAQAWRDHDRYALTVEEWPARRYAPLAGRRVVVLVNGAPGARRSTLSARLAAELGVPVLSAELARDGAALWELLSGSPVGGVVAGRFGPEDVDDVRQGLARSGLDAAGIPEVWCEEHPGDERRLGLGPALDPVGEPPGDAEVARLALQIRAAVAP